MVHPAYSSPTCTVRSAGARLASNLTSWIIAVLEVCGKPAQPVIKSNPVNAINDLLIHILLPENDSTSRLSEPERSGLTLSNLPIHSTTFPELTYKLGTQYFRVESYLRYLTRVTRLVSVWWNRSFRPFIFSCVSSW